MSAGVELKDVSVTFGSFFAAKNVNVKIEGGEFFSFLGPSGCGKTTLGRSILGLIESQSGEVWFEGKNLLSMSKAELRTLRKDMQIIFQDPYSSLNPRMTIGDAILEPMQVHKILSNDTERKERVKDLLVEVGLERAHYHRYPHEFSGGQRQRVCIARALGVNPRFIICDESVSALDVSVQAQVLNLLISLRKKFNFTYIFISHDLSVVKFISDRIMVMQQGETVELGDADEVYNAPKEAYTQTLINAIPKGEIGKLNH